MRAINSCCIALISLSFLSFVSAFSVCFCFCFGRLIKNLVQYSPQSSADAAHLLHSTLLCSGTAPALVDSFGSGCGCGSGLHSADHDKCKKQFIAHLTQFSFFMSSHRGRRRWRSWAGESPRLALSCLGLAWGHACRANRVSLTRTLHAACCLPLDHAP